MSEQAHIQPNGQATEGKVVDDDVAGSPARAAGAHGAGAEGERPKVTDLVDQPAKVMRIGTMVKQLLDEVKSAPLDDAARARLAEIHERSITELEDGLAPELVAELHRISLPFSETATPSDAELRIAQAQLVGWLEGLFHGIQTAMAAQALANQQTATRLQMRQLPPGTLIAPGVIVGENGEPQRAPASMGRGSRPDSDGGSLGQYL
ncbi:bacterial proteasome activator family protein [Specibacter cremeus]|uniref:bacterial proteasome activator family protein n=1 Tax=Specibacter cremeus TaxID=1629051 RepID=UPI000F7935C6|nr:bacterial proteasome activator family protein [Specibacter cremeus]